MFRRPRSLALLVVAAGLAVSGCTTFTDANAAARVGDEEFTFDDLDDVLADFPAEAGPANSAGGFARAIVDFWLQTQAIEQLVDESGGQVTDEDRAQARDEAATDPSFDDFSDATQALLIDSQAAVVAWQRPSAPGPDEVRAIYEAGPANGVACTRHILVETLDAANAASIRLDDGEAFADVAADVSIDPGSAAAGGSLGCIPSEQFAATLVPEYVDAAFAAEIGTPTDPVESQFGFHIIEVIPYDEVDDLSSVEQAALDATASELDEQLLEAVSQLDAYVAPRLGGFTGNPAQLVAPLG